MNQTETERAETDEVIHLLSISHPEFVPMLLPADEMDVHVHVSFDLCRLSEFVSRLRLVREVSKALETADVGAYNRQEAVRSDKSCGQDFASLRGSSRDRIRRWLRDVAATECV